MAAELNQPVNPAFSIRRAVFNRNVGMSLARGVMLYVVLYPAVQLAVRTGDKIESAAEAAHRTYPDLPPAPGLTTDLKEAGYKLNTLYIQRDAAKQPVLINPDDHPDNDLLRRSARADVVDRVREVDNKIATFRKSQQYQDALKGYYDQQALYNQQVETNLENREKEQDRLENAAGVSTPGRLLHSTGAIGTIVGFWGVAAITIGPILARRPTWPLQEKKAKTSA